jgi:hypothetical protein
VGAPTRAPQQRIGSQAHYLSTLLSEKAHVGALDSGWYELAHDLQEKSGLRGIEW